MGMSTGIFNNFYKFRVIAAASHELWNLAAEK
jgi:hypothetical protein